MDTDKKKLVQRVLKLFSLGDKSRNLSEAEAEAAATKARQMMIEHSLSEVDLETYGTDRAKQVAWIIREHTAYTLKRPFALYDDWVANAVTAITDTTWLVHKRIMPNGMFWSRNFVGAEADAAVATELFSVLMETVRRMARNRCGPGWKKTHFDYANGVALRLAHRARETHMPDKQLKAGSETVVAMVLRDKKAVVDEWVNKTYELAKPGRAKKFDAQASAFHAGYADGATVDLGNPRRRLG